jgi:hypothetical protein
MKTYVLFGEDAVREYEFGGIERLKEFISGGGMYELHEFNGTESVIEVLDIGSGWNDFTELTKSEYEKLK